MLSSEPLRLDYRSKRFSLLAEEMYVFLVVCILNGHVLKLINEGDLTVFHMQKRPNVFKGRQQRLPKKRTDKYHSKT